MEVTVLAVLAIAVVVVWAMLRPGNAASKTADTVVEAPPQPVRSLEAVPAAPRANPDSVWVSPQRSVEIAGYSVAGGMVYVGTGLPKVSTFGVEPALIDPKLRVSRSAAAPGEGNVAYWPSYRELTASERATYLRWLAAGRIDPRVNIGYVLLFFYGLERRLLADVRISAAARLETKALVGEVERLLTYYGSNSSFRHHATGLLRTVEALNLNQRFYEKDPPPVDADRRFPIALKIGLAQLAADGKPLPLSWALAWLEADPEYDPRTPGTRCRQEFAILFTLAYWESYGEGCTFKPAPEPLRFFHRPASPTFQGEIEFPLANLTDVTTAPQPIRELRELAMACVNRLAAYSRHLGRFPPDQGSWRALALLPAAYVSRMDAPALQNLKLWLDGLTEEEDAALVELDDVFSRLKELRPRTFTWKESWLFSLFLANLGFGIEPDVRSGGFLLNCGSRCAVFRLPDQSQAACSQRYLAASVLLHLAFLVSGTETTIAASERRNLATHLETALHLSGLDKKRFRATFRLLTVTHSVLVPMKIRLGKLDVDRRRALAHLLMAVVELDTSIPPGDLETLNSIHRALHQERLDIPIRMSRPDPRADHEQEAGSDEPGEASTRAAARIEARLIETAEAVTMLESILQPSRAMAVPLPGQKVPGALRGLDPSYTLAVYRVLKQQSWPREEFERRVERSGEEADAVIEAINDAAIEFYARPLLSGEDPVNVDPELAKKILY